MKKSFLLVLSAFSLAALVACGDDVTNVTEVKGSNMAVLQKGENLSMQSCDTTNIGDMFYVMDSSAAFICDGVAWASMKGVDADLNSSKDSVVLNHVDTVYVHDTVEGLNGKDGASCTAKEIKDGYKIVCGGDSVGVVKNGEMGKQGDEGKSAYEVAVENGFEGSEEEWLESLNGNDGKDLIAMPGAMGSFIDSRDGQVYKTVVIGEQTWMAQNLNYGDSIKTPMLTDATWCGGGENGKKNEGDCAVYGRLYTWVAAVNKSENDCGYGHKCGLIGTVQGICPNGWHLPGTAEWKVLFDAVGGNSKAGVMLKTVSGWNDYESGSGNGLDAYGFSALPAGNRTTDGYFLSVGFHAYFWSASEKDSGYAYYMHLKYFIEDAPSYLGGSEKGHAYSVRCLKD